MSDGLLSITAENSTLGDVLNGVKGVTGASVDAPPTAANERVVLKLGPGQPHDVLQQLFAGSKFDYIILGSAENPASVEKIILTTRTGGATAANNSGPNQPLNQARGYEPPPPPDVSSDNGIDDDTVQADQPQEEVSPPAAGAQQGQIGPNGQPLPADQNQNQNQNPNQQQGPKTPEQLLQELQRMQQQQQQQQQQNPQRGAVPQPQ
jgi:hypothetical protein